MKTTKYNKSTILKKAWSLVRKGWTLSAALRTAWAYARNGASIYKGDAERIFTSISSKHTGLASLQASLNRGL